MGLKKYEIITVGGNKRVRALRSWQVGDRYVNIGDTGGIVYDEKTLSQDGACWLFSGNFGFPGARIGGDSIIDVGEVPPITSAMPAVDILGSSVVVGSKLTFGSEQSPANAVVLTAADFEQGTYGALIPGTQLTKENSAQYVRTKDLWYAGGTSVTLRCEVPGFTITVVAVDRDGNIISNAPTKATGADVSVTVPAGQYFTFMLSKNPVAATTPADATAAKIAFMGTQNTKLSIIDSRVEINPATSTGTLLLRPGGVHAYKSGAKYPEAIIRNSKVSINVSAATSGTFRMMGQIVGSTATLDATVSGSVTIAGLYGNVKNLLASGAVSDTAVTSYDIIQATDCDNFTVSSTIFPGISAAKSAKMPFIFQGCNVPNGRFYHHAQIANTYKDVDFALAQDDLGKAIASGEILVSSEVEGMYRLYSTTGSVFGGLVEGYDSVKSLNMTSIASSYGTTIYKDAYLNGLFDIAGTNVFGGKSPSHPLEQVLNVAPRAVQGTFNTDKVGEPITGVVTNAKRVCVPVPFRINGSKGLTINCPTGIEGGFICTDFNGVVKKAAGPVTGELSVPAAQLVDTKAYLYFGKQGNVAITLADLAGVTVTVYNGCKIVNTGATAVPMKGNIRVEDNATLVNASITGTGYFGGNSIAYRDPKAIDFYGTVHMKDNAVFAPNSTTRPCALVHMGGNAKFVGSVTAADVYLSIIMAGNAIVEGTVNTRSGIVMYGNSRVAPTGIISVSSRGTLVMTDNVSIEANIVFMGNITLAGNYKGNVGKTWVGKRTITDVNEPQYDNNVKSKYDL